MLYIKAYLIQMKQRSVLVFQNVTEGPSTQLWEIKLAFWGMGWSTPPQAVGGGCLAAACVDSGPAQALPTCSQG